MAGVISAFGAYLVAAKKMSGAVKNSDAEQLWTESRSIREWSAERIAELTGIISALEERVAIFEERNRVLRDENHDLIDNIETLHKELADCKLACNQLTEQLKQKEA